MGTKYFKDITTLKIGGKIKHFFEVKNENDLVAKVKFAKENNLPIFIIGEGSDILVSDRDFDGVVIKYTGCNIKITDETVNAEAGVIWDDLVKICVEKNLSGIEKLSGIPGTIGAAPIQNIGAYGVELKDVFISLKAYDIVNEKFVTFTKEDCNFTYRESIFKQKSHWQKYLITQITLKLNKYNDQDLSLQNIRDEILRVRSEKLEDYRKVPNAGSFFKNPIVDTQMKNELLKQFPDLKVFDNENGFKLSAGNLIEKAGWKGRSLGPVKVSDKHALILTNPKGRGNFDDIQKLANAIIEDVYKKFQIKLEPEVQYINI